jgi:hypothetical protein
MKLVGLVLLVTCFGQTARADEVKALGAGANSTCGKWLADRQSGNEQLGSRIPFGCGYFLSDSKST